MTTSKFIHIFTIIAYDTIINKQSLTCIAADVLFMTCYHHSYAVVCRTLCSHIATILYFF